jgi:hypothetical protein
MATAGAADTEGRKKRGFLDNLFSLFLCDCGACGGITIL